MKNPLTFTILGSTSLAILLLSACSPAAPGNVAPGIPLSLPKVETSPPVSAEPTPQTTREAPRNVADLKWSDGSKFTATRIPLNNAVAAKPGIDFKVSYTTRELVDGGKYLDAFALTESGSLVGGMSSGPGPNIRNRESKTSDKVGLYADGEFSPFSEPKSSLKHNREHSIIAGSVADGHAVWSESLTEEPPYENVSMGEWRIVGADLATGESKNLATSTGDTPAYLGEERRSRDGQPRPVIAGKKAYWQAETQTPYAEDLSSPVLSVPLDESEPMKLERSYAEFPARFEEGIATAERTSSNDQKSPTKKIILTVPRKRDQQLLRVADDVEESSGFFTFDADGTVMSFSYEDNFYIVDTAERTAVATKIPIDSAVTGVTHCGANVSWTFQDQNGFQPHDSRYVYNTDSSSLRVLTDPEFTGPARCAGDYLSWSVGTGEGETFKTWDVVTRWNN